MASEAPISRPDVAASIVEPARGGFDAQAPTQERQPVASEAPAAPAVLDLPTPLPPQPHWHDRQPVASEAPMAPPSTDLAIPVTPQLLQYQWQPAQPLELPGILPSTSGTIITNVVYEMITPVNYDMCQLPATTVSDLTLGGGGESSWADAADWDGVFGDGWVAPLGSAADANRNVADLSDAEIDAHARSLLMQQASRSLLFLNLDAAVCAATLFQDPISR